MSTHMRMVRGEVLDIEKEWRQLVAAVNASATEYGYDARAVAEQTMFAATHFQTVLDRLNAVADERDEWRKTVEAMTATLRGGEQA